MSDEAEIITTIDNTTIITSAPTIVSVVTEAEPEVHVINVIESGEDNTANIIYAEHETTIITDEPSTTIIVEPTAEVHVIESIEIGPPGPAGKGVDVVYERLIDAVGFIYYIGEAEFESAEDAAVWRIYRADLRTVAIKDWANGNAEFINKWSERLTLPYS